jgi:hypothetical protein
MDVPTVEQPPPSATPPVVNRAASFAAGRGSSIAARHPLSFWWGVSLAVAILTAIVWPTIPSYDPFSWIVWGREVTDPHLSFFVGGGPSWKPLPFFFTTVYGVIGHASPTLWVITARTGGIAGLIGAWRLSALLCRRAALPEWAAGVAGVVAAVGVILTAPSSGWTYYFFRGASEPLLIGCWLWAIDRLIAGRHKQAFGLLVAEGLMRPESWPFLLVYGVWLWKLPAMRPWVLAGWVLQPVGWFVPPWISTGAPFMAATHASDYNGHLGTDVLKTVLSRGEGLQPLPSLAFAILGVIVALWLGRGALPRGWRAALVWIEKDRSEIPLVAALAIATVGWWVVVVAMTLDHYPGLERFFLPAAAMACVLSGYGLMRICALIGDLAGRGLASAGAGLASRARVPVAMAAAAILLLGSTHYLGARWAYAKEQEPRAATAVTRIDALGTAIKVLGGRSRMLPCRSSVVTINHSLQTAMAWQLETTLGRVQTALRPGIAGIAFVGPRDSIDGGYPPVEYPHSKQLLARVGAWRIYQVWPLGTAKPACLGR